MSFVRAVRHKWPSWRRRDWSGLFFLKKKSWTELRLRSHKHSLSNTKHVLYPGEPDWQIFTKSMLLCEYITICNVQAAATELLSQTTKRQAKLCKTSNIRDVKSGSWGGGQCFISLKPFPCLCDHHNCPSKHNLRWGAHPPPLLEIIPAVSDGKREHGLTLT